MALAGFAGAPNLRVLAHSIRPSPTIERYAMRQCLDRNIVDRDIGDE